MVKKETITVKKIKNRIWKKALSITGFTDEKRNET